MSSKRYTNEFKIEAVKQVTDWGYPVAGVAERLGISQHSLYHWMKQFGVPEAQRTGACSQQDRESAPEVGIAARHRRARHPKKGHGILCQGVPVYAFICAYEAQHAVWAMCR